MWILRWILGALLIIVILGFALQNQSQTVSVMVLKWKTPVLPLYFFLYISFAAGILTWVLVSTLNILKLKGDIHRLQKENLNVKEELNRLRNVNIEDEVEPTELEEKQQNMDIEE